MKIFYIFTILLCIVNSKISPIVLIPGLGGSVLEAKLEDAPSYSYCKTNADWFTIWFSYIETFLNNICFQKNIKLYENDNRIQNATGVQIRPKDFGGVEGVLYSNQDAPYQPKQKYMADLVEFFEKNGYKRGISIRGATYDFRSSGLKEQLQFQYQRLKELVEDTYEINEQEPVNFISHSLGGNFINLFLTDYVDQNWKNKYVKSSIMVSIPVLGTIQAFVNMMIGPQYNNIPQIIPQKTVSPILSTWPSLIWMFPIEPNNNNEKPFWNYTFINTPTKQYSLENVTDFLGDMDAKILKQIYKEYLNTTKKTSDDPNVKVFCSYVYDTKTIDSVYMDDSLKNLNNITSYLMGDGTVSIKSLEGCLRWKNVDSKRYSFNGSRSAHTDMIQHQPLLEDILSWIQSNQ